MTDLVSKPLGKYGEVKLVLENKALKLSVSAELTADDLLTLIENAIPGDFDNKLIDGLKAILAKV